MTDILTRVFSERVRIHVSSWVMLVLTREFLELKADNAEYSGRYIGHLSEVRKSSVREININHD